MRQWEEIQEVLRGYKLMRDNPEMKDSSHSHGPGTRLPLEPRDYMRRRRERRLSRNTHWATQAQAWASQHGFTLRIHNDGHHWMWQKPGFVAEWWPSSAKLVLNRVYEHDFHVPEWTGVIPFLQPEAGGSGDL